MPPALGFLGFLQMTYGTAWFSYKTTEWLPDWKICDLKKFIVLFSKGDGIYFLTSSAKKLKSAL